MMNPKRSQLKSCTYLVLINCKPTPEHLKFMFTNQTPHIKTSSNFSYPHQQSTCLRFPSARAPNNAPIRRDIKERKSGPKPSKPGSRITTVPATSAARNRFNYCAPFSGFVETPEKTDTARHVGRTSIRASRKKGEKWSGVGTCGSRGTEGKPGRAN